MSTDFPQPCVRDERLRGRNRGDRLVDQGPAGHRDRNDGLFEEILRKEPRLFEKLIGVKNVNEAIQLQSDFANPPMRILSRKPPRSAAFIPM